MKDKTYFRIVCLKNQQNGKLDSYKNHYSNLILSDRLHSEDTKSSINPSVAYLSALIQDETKAIKKQIVNPEYTIDNYWERQKQSSQAESQQDSRIKQGYVVKFYEQRMNKLAKEENTMAYLIGQINNKRKKENQKRISRTIRQTIRHAETGQKSRRKQIQQKKYPLSVNRNNMHQEFKNFVTYKEKQKNIVKNDSDSEKNLKKLSITRPQIKRSHITADEKQLNLFNFLKLKKAERACKLASLSKKIEGQDRINKKIESNLLKIVLNPNQQQFDWSKVGKVRQHHYTLRTIESSF